MNKSLEEKNTLLGWKTALGVIISIFLAGVVSVVMVTSYLDERAQELFYQKSSGLVLEQKVQIIEENLKSQETKMDTLINQQTQIFIEMGKINGKLDNIHHR